MMLCLNDLFRIIIHNVLFVCCCYTSNEPLLVYIISYNALSSIGFKRVYVKVLCWLTFEHADYIIYKQQHVDNGSFCYKIAIIMNHRVTFLWLSQTK